MKYSSALLFDLSGSIGGAVASRSRGNVGYFRKRTIPSNPQTFMQKAARDGMTSSSAYWRSIMTEEEQELWWDEATGSQTGQSLFNKINQPRFFANNSLRIQAIDGGFATLAVRNNVPENGLSTPFTTPGDIIIDDSAGLLTIDALNVTDPFIATSATGSGKNGALYVYCSHQQNASRFSRQHPYQLVGVGSFGGDSVDQMVVDLATLGFGLTAGKVMYVKLVAQEKDGGISTALIQRVTVVA